jgi:glycosyl hydrolase family 2/F5/8 type C domain-containing protein
MNRARSLILLLGLVIIGSPARAAEPLRERLNINRQWKFDLGDHPGAQAFAFDDSQWESIGLPHSFSAPYFQSKDFYTGYGWYRKTFDAPSAWSGKRLFLEFDGAFQDAEVFVNGQPVGRHLGGYTGFSFDITSAARPGRNVLAVRLNNNWNPRLAPRAGDSLFAGGIYRDVWLVITDPLHVTWYGTFVTTPAISNRAAIVDVKTEVQNQAAVSRNVLLQTEILDPDGNSVARLSSSQTIDAGATATIDQTSPSIPNPRLWNPDHPLLYRAVTTVFDGDKPVDDYQTTFGIRWIKWTADQGFFINGDHLYFHGADVHQDHAGWANAATQAGVFRDVKLIKDAGLNFIRGSHYPHHPAFADACDKLGVLFWSENCFWGCGGTQKDGTWNASAYPANPDDQAEFEQSVENSLRDEIRIFRNHPSIVAWSMCNEVYFSRNLDKVKNLLTRMVKLTHQLDPTRPAAIGGCQRGGLDKLGDIAGYNGDGARLFPNPGIPSIVSEYGSVSSNRPGKYDGQFKPKDGLDADTPEYPWRSGQVVWCGFDYGTIFGPLAGSKGIVDYARIPKRSWYWYRNTLLHIPPPAWPEPGIPAQLAVTSDKSTIAGTDATDDAQILVTVEDAAAKPLSNSPAVTLTIESGPGEFPTGRSITFDSAGDIPIRDGKAAIELRSYYAGPSVIRATSPGLTDGVLTISTLGAPAFIPGSTPTAPDRPYVRFVRASQPAIVGNQDVAANRPTAASSEAPGHNAASAIDGDVATYWSASDEKPGAWWQVDLEQPHTITSVHITFANAGNYRYKIEGSADGNAWALLVDQTGTQSTDKVRTDPIPGDHHVQVVRLTFTGLPPGQRAALADVTIEGKHWP